MSSAITIAVGLTFEDAKGQAQRNALEAKTNHYVYRRARSSYEITDTYSFYKNETPVCFFTPKGLHRDLPLTRTLLSECCFSVVQEMAMHPRDIVEGECDTFADGVIRLLLGSDVGELTEELNGPVLHWGLDDITFFTCRHEPATHCYIYFDDAYFDAEEPYGVPRPDHLPYFMGQLLKD